MQSDTLFSPDSLHLMSNIKRTIAMMHQTMLQMQPIVERQLEVIQSQRFIANIGLLIILISFLVCLYFSIRHAQGVKKFSQMKFKKRIVAIFLGVWLIVIATFNIFPGMLLLEIDKTMQQTTLQDSQNRLYGVQK